jgi:hypothetical protein
LTEVGHQHPVKATILGPDSPTGTPVGSGA